MNAVEDYARRWIKRGNEELDTLSEWVKIIRRIIRNITPKVIYPSLFSKPESTKIASNARFWKSKTQQCSTSASYLDILLKLDTSNKLTTQLYTTNGMSFISPLSTFLTYVAIFHFHLHVSQLIRYARARSIYDQFLIRGSQLTKKLVSQGFLLSRL
jgi:hypothetical protein